MINSFKGEYKFLSNFSDSPMKLDLGPLGVWCVLNVEEVYQAAKCADNAEAIWVLRSGSPWIAKQRGREIKMRVDWDDIKLDVMRQYVTEKFKQNPALAEKLKDTGDEELVEGNTWGDTFWGVCKGEGQNQLGKILMEIRSGLSNN